MHHQDHQAPSQAGAVRYQGVQAQEPRARPIRQAFVTGATGLLGNNLVRELAARGIAVRALARSVDKARQQFADLPQVQVVKGDMGEVGAFAAALAGCDVVFHAAAHFRDSYKGGRHWDELRRINVDGTAALIAAAHAAGVRRFVHTSSIAVLDGPPGTLIDETCDRLPADADDYYRSKILADDAVRAFLRLHPDMHACFVLPGWMWGQAISGRPRRGNWSMTWRAASCRGWCPAVSRWSMPATWRWPRLPRPNVVAGANAIWRPGATWKWEN